MAGLFLALVPAIPACAAGQAESPATIAHPPGQLCGFLPGQPVADKVLIIWEENQNFNEIIGSPGAPFINQVVHSCGLATAMQAVTHPSLPNYLSETSGLSYARDPFNTDCDPAGSCLTPAPSIFSQESDAGNQWRSYAESMPKNCDHSNSGLYAPRHNPAVYFSAISSRCSKWDVPLGSKSSGHLAKDAGNGRLPSFSTLTPNVKDDMHDGSVAQADAWLGHWLPVITSGPDYQAGRLVVLIVWDEGEGGGNAASHVPLVVLSAGTPAGIQDATAFDNYSILRTAEDLTGVPLLGQAAGSPSLTTAFHL